MEELETPAGRKVVEIRVPRRIHYLEQSEEIADIQINAPADHHHRPADQGRQPIGSILGRTHPNLSENCLQPRINGQPPPILNLYIEDRDISLGRIVQSLLASGIIISIYRGME